MTFSRRSSLASDNTGGAKRAVLYLRVSTGRQAAGDVSLPSQRDLTRRYCEAQGWDVVDEFVEPGASATDDRRPVFQRMLERATDPGRNFDVICVHSFSRFYRNGAEMELTIRRLRKLGVEVVSVTQPTGDDPAQELMRQMIGIFDEYTSRENGKNVTRAMRESARQGFWNGATPPLGYRIVEAERRGSKIKKKLEVDPPGAEIVRLIFKLYTEGDGRTGPLGVKETANWLNRNGYRTRRGALFGVGPVHVILRNRCYATGKWPYGVRNSRTGGRHDPETVVEIPVPALITEALFARAQNKLAAHNSKVLPPRAVNGPTLLTGIAVCATCGAGMTRTGTRRRDRVYAYYSCAGCQQKGTTQCRGRHVPMEKLDRLVVDGLKERLFRPDRLAALLQGLADRQASRNANLNGRLLALHDEVAQINARLDRLYASIENGIVELDELLRERIARLKADLANAGAAIERAKKEAGTDVAVDPERVVAFGTILRDKIENGDIIARKSYIRAVISHIEVDDRVIRIVGTTAALTGAANGNPDPYGNVRGFVRKWRARNDSNVRPSDS